MASRKRRNKKDHPVEGRKKPNPEEGTVSPEYGTGRKIKWDEEDKALQTDRDYGSGNRPEERDTDPPQHNNYDGYDRTYPPSQER